MISYCEPTAINILIEWILLTATMCAFLVLQSCRLSSSSSLNIRSTSATCRSTMSQNPARSASVVWNGCSSRLLWNSHHVAPSRKKVPAAHNWNKTEINAKKMFHGVFCFDCFISNVRRLKKQHCLGLFYFSLISIVRTLSRTRNVSAILDSGIMGIYYWFSY